jgi:hypothetical protein
MEQILIKTKDQLLLNLLYNNLSQIYIFVFEKQRIKQLNFLFKNKKKKFIIIIK